MSIYTPYTYLIGWSNHNIFYYGVRYARDCHPNDLWESYFTSSKYVKTFREEHGEPDIIQIRKTFTDSSAAREWEDRVIDTLKLHRRENFLNKNRSRGFDLLPDDIIRWNKDPERCRKISETKKGVKLSKEHCAAISRAAKLRDPSTRFHSEDTKKKMSEIALDNNPGFSAVYSCPKCGKKAQKANISKWHGLDGEKCRW